MKPPGNRGIPGVMNTIRGFTLIELMVALLVAAIIVTFAVPGFRSMVERNRIAAVVNQFVGGVAFARSAAVTRATPVTLCPSTTGTSCNNTAPWQDGWIAFTDGGTAGKVDGSDRILRVAGKTSGMLFSVSSGFSKVYITISPVGFVPGGGGVLNVCPAGSDKSGAQISLSPTGTLTSHAYTCP